MRIDYDDFSYRDPHDLCKQRGYARKDSKASLCARLRKMGEVESARGLSMKESRTQQDAADSRGSWNWGGVRVNAVAGLMPI